MAHITPVATDLSIPAELPELAITPDRAMIFSFSAATWNRHRIHYDKDAALNEGHADIVVQRGLIGNFMARLLTTWLADSGHVRELSWKVLRSALPDQPLRCRGTVVHREDTPEGRNLSCEVQVVNSSNEIVASGKAKLFVTLAAAGRGRPS